MKNLVLFIILMVFATGCATGSTLRTARVLDQGDFEISAGLAGNQFGHVSQVVVGAYGITDEVEIEGRWEDQYVALTPRVQILKSETSYVDCLAFFEVGYSSAHELQWGPGVMVGRRWSFFEPYLSYRFRHCSSVDFDLFSYTFHISRDVHYLKAGSRIFIPCFWKKEKLAPSNWFVGLEMGPTLLSNDAIFEWAANIGFEY